MSDENIKDNLDSSLIKIPRKIEEVQEWMVTAGMSISAANHKNRELGIKINKIIEKDLPELKDLVEKLKNDICEMNVKIDNIKSGMDKVEKKFTWSKIFASAFAIVTSTVAAIGGILIFLKNMGIFN